MHAFPIALLWAAVFGVIAAVLGAVRSDRRSTSIAVNGIATFVVSLIVDWILFYAFMPAWAQPVGFWPILIDAVIMLIIAAIVDFMVVQSGSAGLALKVIAVIAVLGVWIVGVNAVGHDAKAASSIVQVSEEKPADMPASSTTNMVVVSPDIAAALANRAMSSGVAGQRNYNTYLELGSATLQFVDGKMWYVFPLQFDSWRNKSKLQGIEPGYIMVSAEDPNAQPVERYDGQYSMKVCTGCMFMAEPDRYAYLHGYHDVLDDPTLELDDQGLPYWTMTVDTPHVAWRFYAPKSLLVINANDGTIHDYALDKAPEWVDRIYSQDEAKDLANWYGKYNVGGWKHFWNTGVNQFQVSGDPVLVYTGDGHPDWRMLLTSLNSDAAVSHIVLMDSHTGAMRVYAPASPMGIEAPVLDAFNSASGTGAGQVKSNRYHAEGLTLHVIYGRLTWMATYEPEAANPSFIGIGFVDAYQVNAANVVFGNSKSAALENYRTQLANETSSNGNAPGAGSQDQSVSGTITDLGWDVAGGTKYYYLTLDNDAQYAYKATTDAVGPAITLAKIGDKVNITYTTVGDKESVRTVKSFTDARVPLTKAGG